MTTRGRPIMHFTAVLPCLLYTSVQLGLSNTANAESFDEEYPHGTCSVGACDGAPITYDNTPAPRIDPDWSNNNGGPTADKEELDLSLIHI